MTAILAPQSPFAFLVERVQDAYVRAQQFLRKARTSAKDLIQDIAGSLYRDDFTPALERGSRHEAHTNHLTSVFAAVEARFAQYPRMTKPSVVPYLQPPTPSPAISLPQAPPVEPSKEEVFTQPEQPYVPSMQLVHMPGLGRWELKIQHENVVELRAKRAASRYAANADDFAIAATLKPTEKQTRSESLAAQVYTSLPKKPSIEDRLSAAHDARLGRFSEEHERPYTLDEITQAAGVSKETYNTFTTTAKPITTRDKAGTTKTANLSPYTRSQMRNLNRYNNLELALSILEEKGSDGVRRASVKQAALATGVSTSSLYKAMHEHGMATTMNASARKRLARVAQAEDLYCTLLVVPESARLEAVAAHMGLSKKTVENYLGSSSIVKRGNDLKKAGYALFAPNLREAV